MTTRPHPWLPTRLAALALLALATGPGCGAEAGGAPSSADGAGDAPSEGADDGGRGLVFVPGEAPAEPSYGEGPARPYFHDFGRVPDGEVAEHVFRLRNTDPRPVAIKRVVPSCGCTVPSVRYVADDGSLVHGEPITSKAPELLSIPPGALVELALRIETADIRDKNVDKLLMVTVTTDSPNGYYLTLETHIVASRPFELVPNGIQLGAVAVNGGGGGAIEAVRALGFDERLTGVLRTPPGVTAELVPRDPPDGRAWTVSARLAPPLELGAWKGELLLATETAAGEPGEPLVVPMAARVVPDLQCDPARLVFYADPGAFGHTTLSSLLPGHRLRVLEAAVDPAHRELLAVSFEPAHPDGEGRSGEWTLRLEPRDPLATEADLLSGEVVLRLDDAQHPEVRVPYAVHVRR